MSLPGINAAIYSRLANTAAITAIVGTRIYPMIAEEGAATPYIVFYLGSEVNSLLSPHKDFNDVYRIAGWGEHPSQLTTVINLTSAIHTAFDGQALTITGYTNYWLVYERMQRFIETVSGKQFVQIVADYRIRVST